MEGQKGHKLVGKHASSSSRR